LACLLVRTRWGAWSTAATPGVRDEDEVRDGLSLAGEVHSTDPVTTLPSDGGNDLTERETNVDKKNVRFAGPDGVPLSPATTFVSMDSYVAPQGPPPTVFFEPDEAKATAATSTFETRTPADGSRDISSLGSGTAQRKTDSPIIRSTPSAPVKPAAAPIAPSAPLPSPELKTPIASLDTKSIERCQKHCKWAISALDYEDLDTARAELRKALAMLEG
jgi:vacuolar protein sorting-associated protein VTA1